MNVPASSGTLVLHTPESATYVFTMNVQQGAELYKVASGKAVRFPLVRGDSQSVSTVHLVAGVDVLCRGIACVVHGSKLPEQALAG